MRGVGLLVTMAILAGPAHADDTISLDGAKAILVPGQRSTCADVECLIGEAYAADPKARDLALALFRATGDAAWPALQAVEDNGAWNELEHDNVVFGPMPSEPEGCDAGL